MLLKFLGIIFVLLYFPKGEMVMATDYTDVLIVENSAENYIVTEAIKKCIDEPSKKLKKGAFQSASAYYCAEKNFQEFARDIWKRRRK